MDRSIDRSMVRWRDGRMAGWADGLSDGLTDGGADMWVDGMVAGWQCGGRWHHEASTTKQNHRWQERPTDGLPRVYLQYTSHMLACIQFMPAHKCARIHVLRMRYIHVSHAFLYSPVSIHAYCTQSYTASKQVHSCFHALCDVRACIYAWNSISPYLTPHLHSVERCKPCL